MHMQEHYCPFSTPNWCQPGHHQRHGNTREWNHNCDLHTPFHLQWPWRPFSHRVPILFLWLGRISWYDLSNDWETRVHTHHLLWYGLPSISHRMWVNHVQVEFRVWRNRAIWSTSYELRKFLVSHSHVCRLCIGNEIVHLVAFTYP